MRKSTYFLSLFLTALFLLSWSGVKAETLTVADGTATNVSVPICSYYFDMGFKAQIIYPATDLGDLEGGTISGIKFYSSTASQTWSGGTIYIKIAEVEDDALTTTWLTPTFTDVYSGSCSIASNEMSMTFTTNFTYSGENNLLIEVGNSATSYTTPTINFYGVSATAASHSSRKKKSTYSYGDGVVDFRPKTTFTYTPGTPSGCPKPKNLAKDDTKDKPDAATFTWEQNDSETTYQWACVAKDAEVTSWNTLEANVRTKEVTGLTAGTSYDFWVRSDCSTEQSTGVKLNFTPTCPAPTYGATPVSNKSHNSATVTWIAASDITKYQYVCVLKNATPDWTGVEAKEATSAALSNLAELTEYDFYVRSWYSATAQSAAVKTSFQTTADCSAKTVDAQHNWEENFTNQTTNAMPLCWTAAGYNGAVYVASSSSYITFSYGKALYFTGGGNAYAYAILPDFTNDLNTLQITFSHVEESSTNSGQIQFGYFKDDTFTPLHTCAYSTSSSAWRDEAAIVITGVPDGAKLAFGYKPNKSAYTAAVDNISISLYEAPACAAPTALAVSEIGTNSAKVTWNSEATNFALEYKKTSDADWTAATGTIASPLTLSGLAANETEYTVRVQAICGETPSDWVELANPFKTDCVDKSVTELAAWTENFESQESGKLATCWEMTDAATSGAYTEVNASAAKDGSLGLQVYAYATNTEIVMLPTFETEIKNLKISFDYKNYGENSNYGALEVGYYSGGAFTNVATLDKTTSFTASGEIEMPNNAPDGARIAFRVVGKKSNYNSSAYIDNISVIRKPSCAVPTITAANATSDGAVVTWTPGDEESAWNLRYSVKDADTWTVKENVTTGYAITGLSVGTTYEVQVQANCGGAQSAWSASTEFEPVCNAPSALAVTARTQTSATFSWTSSESAWKLQYKAADAEWEAATEVNVAANPFTLTGLTAGTTYQAKIQSACGSAFSNVVEFTTWCDSKLSLPVELTSFSAIPACWEESPAGAVSFASSKLCFVGEGERFLYLPQSNINLNLLSVTLTFSGSLELGYISEPNGAFTQLVASVESGTEYDLATLAPEAPKYLAIRYNGANSLAQSAISAISIRKTPTCFKPTDVAATPGAGSASISWTAGGSETAWNLQYKLASAASWSENIAISETPSHSLTGLEQGLSYKVRVQAACAGEDPSDWSDEASLITDCEGIAALAWDADFSQALSNCWTIYAQDEIYYKPVVNTIQQDLQISGGKDGASNNVVILPLFDADLSVATMSFEYSGSIGSQYAQLKAGYVTDKADTTSFVALETLTQKASYTQARIALNTVPADAYLAFRYAGGTEQGDQYIKNLRISRLEIFSDDADDIESRLAALKTAGETIDILFNRTLIDNKDYNTFCVPFSLNADQLAASPLANFKLKAFDYAAIEGTELLIAITNASSIEAGVPYFVANNENGEVTEQLFQDVTITAATPGKVDKGDVSFQGVFDKDTLFAQTGADHDQLFLGAGNTIYWPQSDKIVKGFRAYFNVLTGGSALHIKAGMPVRIVERQQTPTGCENVQSESKTLKFIENNQVVIIRNGVKYSVQGQVISK